MIFFEFIWVGSLSFGILILVLIVIWVITRCRNWKSRLSREVMNKRDVPDISEQESDYPTYPQESKDEIRTQISAMLREAQKKIDDQNFSEAKILLVAAQERANVSELFGFLHIIDQKLALCDLYLNYEEKRTEYLRQYEEGQITTAFLGMVELLDEALHLNANQHQDFTFLQSLRQNLQYIEEGVKHDKQRIKDLLTKLNGKLEEGQYFAVEEQLKSFQSFCKNLRFDEFIPQIEGQIRKAESNKTHCEQLENELVKYEKGNLRLAYNGLDVLDRRAKLAKNDPLLTSKLKSQISANFAAIRSELIQHKKELQENLWKVYQLTNGKQFKEARKILGETEIIAKKYDFFGILRDIEGQRKEIRKFEEYYS